MGKGNIGGIAFLIGFFLAVVLPALGTLVNLDMLPMAVIGLFVALLGLVVGFLNITTPETVPILLAAIFFTVAGGLGALATLPYVGGILSAALGGIATFSAPVGLVVAIKTFWDKASK